MKSKKPRTYSFGEYSHGETKKPVDMYEVARKIYEEVGVTDELRKLYRDYLYNQKRYKERENGTDS